MNHIPELGNYNKTKMKTKQKIRISRYLFTLSQKYPKIGVTIM
jgi:hypothetical protein